MNLLNDLAQERLSTSRASLMNAFAHVIEMAGRRQVTDLHVRRLLCYVRAHDRYYSGVARSLAQLASLLVLSVPTCRRVIRRAVEDFGLLIVIPQRHYPGGQTVNRYTINWDAVDALLLDSENANCPSCSDLPDSSYSPNTYDLSSNSPAIRPSCYDLKPDHLAPEACLIAEDRILSSHPRLLLLPDHLIPEDSQWPWATRRAPKETSKELLAHFDVLLTKLQAAIDRAQELAASNIEDRLRTLQDKLEAVHYRASHAALCRTNLPPINPLPDFSWQSTPLGLPTNPTDDISTVPNDQCALSDHPPSDPLCPSPAHSPSCYDFACAARTPSCYDPSDCRDQAPPSTSALQDLLVALDELLAALTAALQCASDHGIAWLHNRFATIRRRIKTIRARANALTEVHVPSSLKSDHLTPEACLCPSCYDLAPTHVLNLQRHPCLEPAPPLTSCAALLNTPMRPTPEPYNDSDCHSMFAMKANKRQDAASTLPVRLALDEFQSRGKL